MKVVVAQPIDRAGIDMIVGAGHDVEQLDHHDPASLERAVVDAAGLLVRDALVPRSVIEAGAGLKVISRHGAGLDRIDVTAATEQGVVVTYAPEANSAAVAEHVLALVLALAKRLIPVDAATRAGKFEECYQATLGFGLEGRTLGILGLGNVGRRLADKAALGFGMRVVGYDPYADRAVLGSRVEVFDDWRDVLRVSDVVSLHTPLTTETRGLIDRSALCLMKPTAILVNCARGAVVVEDDLVSALKEGVIAGAGIDVFDPQPPLPDHPLFDMPNVVVTAHTAAKTEEAMYNMAVQAAQGIVEVLGGRVPTWAANRAVVADRNG